MMTNPDYVCAHCGLPCWNWSGEDEYVCPNGCCSMELPGTTILRPWNDALDAGKWFNPTWTDDDKELLREAGIPVAQEEE
jgi:hypothetical protein